ncbi:MAG: Cytidine deaminase [Candidatus Dichloromethanomonas elyunquensis]|nr:MAG: Cytidine deaminase [Candidatus Dichloromethanomonas elyunquensis]
MGERYRELCKRAAEACDNAYTPYSHYKVGAAVLWESGIITSGSNVENASYGLTVCAERNAIFAGACLGERKICAVAVAVPADNIPSPCGACRQVIREFAEDCDILLINGKGQSKKTTLGELLPDSFGAHNLN